MSEKYFVGVDVGTGSVRAALVTQAGKVLKVHVKETKTWNPLPDHYEQSSDNIWNGVCECVQVINCTAHFMRYYFICVCSTQAFPLSLRQSQMVMTKRK